jgi:hypothetical protein
MLGKARRVDSLDYPEQTFTNPITVSQARADPTSASIVVKDAR